MPLFQTSVLKKYLRDIDQIKLHQSWEIFRKHFHNLEIQENIRNLKEEEYQGLFIEDLFVKILGYTLKPQPGFIIVLEKKSVTDSTKSDAAILAAKEVIAVIELKDTSTTDLAKVSNQAFGYKHKHKKCTYVITSNFEKLRFYINDSVEEIEFDLFKLSEEEFGILWLCLAHENLLADLPLKINQQSLIEEGKITKKLYSDYSQFKKDLFSDILKNNSEFDKLELFRKTQKLLDRFLFIFFAEDRLLLPTNLIIKITNEWQQLQKMRVQQSLYDRFRLYFKDLNEGNNKEEIFAYNGGLFEPDAILDTLKINDKILQEGVVLLSSYDYNTEVDVNILGHIFEYSLNEIEQMQAEIKGSEIDPNKTRRKKEGVFYTPRFITKFMVETTLGQICVQKKSDLRLIEEDFVYQKFKTNEAEDKRKKKLLKILDAYSSWLLKLAICDPACGSGAFLNAALEFLIDEHRFLDALTKKLLGYSIPLAWTTNDILEHNLFGVDINEEAVEIARLSLWLRTASKERKLSNLSRNIKCGNSLISKSTSTQFKSFDWEKEFPEVFANGRFDIIIGNPPYVDIKALPNDSVDYIFKNFQSADNRINLFAVFIERALAILKNSGLLSFIIPSAFLTQESYEKLREILLSRTRIKNIIRLPNESFGGSAGEVKVDTIILTIELSSIPKSDLEVLIYKGFERITEISKLNSNQHFFVNQAVWARDKNYMFRINVNENISSLLTKIETNTIPLISCANFSLGITPYDKYTGHTAEQIEQRVFHSNWKKDNSYRKLLAGNDITRYYVEWNGEEWISYGDWLGAARESKFFTQKRILVKQIIDWSAKRIWAAMTDEELYNTQNAFNLIAKPGYSTEYLLAVLNSKLMSFYHRKKFLEEFKDRFQKILIKDTKQFPIKLINDKIESVFVETVNRMLEKISELQKLKKNFLHLLTIKFPTITISKKLSNWPSLTEKDFINEMDRQKTTLSLDVENQWLKYFEHEKEKASIVINLINNIDHQIDDLIYEIYNISSEEKSIIDTN